MVILALVSVLLTPWHGKALSTTPTGEDITSWAMTVRGAPRAHVDLRADGVAKGWIASFCTLRLCAPFHTIATLDSHGVARYEFSLIRTDPKGPRHARAIVRADGRQAGVAKT